MPPPRPPASPTRKKRRGRPASVKNSRHVDKHYFDSRIVMVTGEISHTLAERVCVNLFALAQAGNDPITVIISSPGGHVESGDMIHDMIKFIKPRVRVLGSGWVASAGALIYIAADKKDRYILPNTRFLLHAPSGGPSFDTSRTMISLGAITGGADTSRCTWSLLTTPLIILISKLSHVCRTSLSHS